MENVKIGFFKRAKRAIFNFDEYERFMTEDFTQAIKYFLKMILIFAIIITAVVTYKVYEVGPEEIMSQLWENMSAEQQAQIDITEITNTLEQTKGNVSYIIFFALTMLTVLYISYTLILFIDVFIGSILGLIINLIINTKFKYVDIFKLAIYSITLPLTLLIVYQVVNLLAGYTVKYFSYAYDAISYIYLITAMMTIKGEMIKNMQEVQKVVEVQKEVKKELEEEKKNKKQEDKKKEKKKKEEEEAGEPEGNNA